MFNLGINSADRAEFLRVGRHNLLTSIKNEPQTLTMYSTHADHEDNDNYIFEVYHNDAAYQIHANSPQFRAYAEMAKRVIKRRSITPLTPQLLVEQPTSFTLTQTDPAVVKLHELTLNGQQADQLITQLNQVRKQNPQLLAILAGKVTSHPTHWIVVLTYQDQSATKQQAKLFTSLPDKEITLQPDLIVSHGGLNYQI